MSKNYARLLAGVYAMPADYYPPTGIPQSNRLVFIAKGTVGEIIGSYTHEHVGVAVTLIEFNNLVAALGATIWEYVEDAE